MTHKKPNILMIFADDVGYGDTSVYGASKVSTPNIDKLAAEGRMFTDAHSASAICTPSRYAMLTGEFPHRRDLHDPVMNDSPCLIKKDTQTIPKMLKSQGYSTGLVGKWHLGFGDEPKPDWNEDLKPGPLEAGFDYYYGMPIVAGYAPYVWVENHRVVGLDASDPLIYGGVPATRPYPEKYIEHVPMSGARLAHDLFDDEKIAETEATRAKAWLRAQAGKDGDDPFFLLLASSLIHHPFTPGKAFQGKSGAGPYGDFIEEFDWLVGELLGQLDDLGLREDTLVVFTSDNGGMLNLGGQEAWRAGHKMNGDLLGFKFDTWEGGHRVPFITRWPSHVEPNTTCDELLVLTDLYATFAHLVGHDISELEAPDSINQWKNFTGEAVDPVRNEALLSAFKRENIAIRSGDWIFMDAQGGGGWEGAMGEHLFGGPNTFEYAGVEHSDYNGTQIKADAPSGQLYNLRDDPYQRVNLFSEHPDRVKALRTRIAELRQMKRTASI